MRYTDSFFRFCRILVLGGLAACAEDEGANPLPEPPGDRASLSVRIDAAPASPTKAGGDENTRVGDANAREGEWINTLRVFVLEEASSTVQCAWDLADGSAWTDEGPLDKKAGAAGNVSRWISEATELPAGNYRLYAFANWETMGNEAWNKVVNAALEKDDKAGSELKDADIAAIVLENPASKVSLGGENPAYIPMSAASGMIRLAHKAQVERLELVRTVARVDAELVNNRREEVDLSDFTLTMGKFADRIYLMPREEQASEDVQVPEGTKQETTVSYPFAADTKIASGESLSFSFYVNETRGKDYFTVTLANGMKSYSGTLKQTASILRNQILPLTLTLTDDSYTIEVEAYVAPIGGYPWKVGATGPNLLEGGGYEVGLPEGCTFRIHSTSKDTGATAYCELALSADDEDAGSGFVAIENDGGEKPTWAHITALPGKAGSLIVIFPDGTRHSLQITTTDLSALTTKTLSK